MKHITSLFIILLTTTIIASENPNNYTIKLFTEHNDLITQIPFVAHMRVEYFKGYPYLYDGNVNEEIHCLSQHYASHPNSALAIVYHDKAPVGFLCGTDLINYSALFENSITDLFQQAELNPKNYYYVTDIIITPEHRGKHLPQKLFEILEAYAHTKGYKSSCFITRFHAEEHPLKPYKYRSLVSLWNRLGYTQSSLLGYMNWQTHQIDGGVKQEQHPLIFWLKDLK